MPLTSAYWPMPFVSVAQSVFIVVLLLCSMELRRRTYRLRSWLEFIGAAVPADEAEKPTAGFEPATRSLQIRRQLNASRSTLRAFRVLHWYEQSAGRTICSSRSVRMLKMTAKSQTATGARLGNEIDDEEHCDTSDACA